MCLFKLRTALYSPVCDVDSSAYQGFLNAVGQYVHYQQNVGSGICLADCQGSCRSGPIEGDLVGVNCQCGGLSGSVSYASDGVVSVFSAVASGTVRGQCDVQEAGGSGGEKQVVSSGCVEDVVDISISQCEHGQSGSRAPGGGSASVELCGGDNGADESCSVGGTVDACEAIGQRCGVGREQEHDVAGSIASAGTVSGGVRRGKNFARNLAKRMKKKADKVKNGSVPVVTDDRSELQKSFDVRRIAENKLAAQKAEFQLKRNEYMTKSRVSELEWETRRLQTDQKLAKISEARLGSKPGFAETLIENNISSTSLPSLSKGTISPDSSISVEEVRKMEKLIETLSGQVQSLTTQLNGLQESVKANQRFGGKFDLDENDKIIMPRFKTPDERLEWMAKLSDEEMEALGPDYHRDGRILADGSRLSFDGHTEDYSLQDEAMERAGITMIG